MGFEIPHILSRSVSVGIRSSPGTAVSITHAYIHAGNMQIHSYIRYNSAGYCITVMEKLHSIMGGSQGSWRRNCSCDISRKETEKMEIERQKRSGAACYLCCVWTLDDPVVFTQVVLWLLPLYPPCQTSFIQLLLTTSQVRTFVDKQNISWTR